MPEHSSPCHLLRQVRKIYILTNEGLIEIKLNMQQNFALES